MTTPRDEREWRTRRERIDPRLDAAGWRLPAGRSQPASGPYRSEETETDNGPADYALWLAGDLVGVIEAKRVGLGPQEVIRQAERYSRGSGQAKYNFRGLRVPFLYSTNGEKTFFYDGRHKLNLSRPVADFHTPAALGELLARDFDAACDRLLALPHDNEVLWPYQKQANAAVERAIAERKRRLLIAMATGTGKTFTFVNEIYRLMKSGVAKRILYLVDRRALAAQAVRAFASFEAEPGQKFDQLYEVYGGRFQKEDFEEEAFQFDPKAVPPTYLTDPQPGHAFVYVCTIQRMAINILGKNAIFGLGRESFDEDADRVDIPIHAFDVIVADECHRGYTSQELSVWRSTLDHFDAIKIGLTATPAAHTAGYFHHKAFEYTYAQAVADGYLVDYDVVKIRSDVRVQGVFLPEGENVELVDPETGLSRMDQLEDERAFDTSDVESKVTAPDSNRKILEEIKKYADDHLAEYGRYPKTLIFAVHDLPHTSHADQLVRQAREIFGQGEAFVQKITGKVDRPLQRIREFRNRPEPTIAVTVDLLSTGVDLPDLEFIVLLRPVKSRILFEQMLGRGTRRGEKIAKSHFTVFDCFDGTILEYFRQATGITAEEPLPPTRAIHEIIEDIWANRDRDYNIGCLAKRLHRIDKQMSAEGRELFAEWVPEGDLRRFARALRQKLREDFTGIMALLRDARFQELLVGYPRASWTFVRAVEHEDEVASRWLIRDREGRELMPEDYLESFARFVRENPQKIGAIQVLLDRPREWSAQALRELRDKLLASRENFSIRNLQRAHQLHYRKALVDIISMVHHAVDAGAPLLTAAERVASAFERVERGKRFTADEQQWLDRIREVMVQNLSIDRADFEDQPGLTQAGAWGAARRAFGEERLVALLSELNEAVAA